MREKELRLALVCYGGISLAVYMHGITKEIWRLAKASEGFLTGGDPGGGSERVYRALLGEIEEKAGIRLRVLVDIVAGASAGGINGIFLAQAIATGQSLEPLTDLWLTSADIEALIDPAQAPATKLTKAWALPLAWMAAQRSGDDIDALVEAGARREVRAKLSHFIRSRWFEPPFGGKLFSGLLLDALGAMAAAPRGRRLLPAGQPLDLMVTMTDFRGHPERLKLHSPPEVVETEHRLVACYGDKGEALDTLGHPAELVYAARATSSFPGAFPPFTVAELDAVLAERGIVWPERDAFLARTLPRQAAAQAAEGAVLIDGSVLANAPFRPAIEALKERPARRQIDRRFVYIDPSPGNKLHVGRPGQKEARPGFFQTIIGAASELPRHQPIRDNLDAIAEKSRRIEAMRGVIASIRPEIDATIERLFGHTLFLDSPTVSRLAAWRARAQAAAANNAGYAYAAYGRLKLAGVIEGLVELLYAAGDEAGPEHRERIARHVEATVTAAGYDAMKASFAAGASKPAIDFLRRYDLGFRIRRLRMLARRVSALEAQFGDADLAQVREAVYLSLADYLECKRTERHAHLRKDVRLLRGDAGPLLGKLADSLDLRGLDTRTEQRLAAAFEGLKRAIKRPILFSYLGFPFFDVATLPLLQGEGIDEFDPIKVDRIAPDDARSIRAGGAEATLKGIQFNTFGAFFSRAYRENDYLWGRLHGAERMIDIVISTLDAGAGLGPGRVAAIKRAAFQAILDEEEARLTAVPALIASLRREIG